jgi:hypothetical protein
LERETRLELATSTLARLLITLRLSTVILETAAIIGHFSLAV